VNPVGHVLLHKWRTSDAPYRKLYGMSAFSQVKIQMKTEAMWTFSSSEPSSQPFLENYEDWKHFSDMFTASIASNTNFTDCQRFHYLISYLSRISETYSRDQWKLQWSPGQVRKTVQQKTAYYPIISEQFLKLPSATTSSISTVRKLVDGADKVIRGLRAL